MSEIDLSPVTVNPRRVVWRASDARAAWKVTGQNLTTLTDGTNTADQLQGWAFVELRRRERDAGHEMPDSAELWALAEEVDVILTLDVLEEPRQIDPLSGPSY